MSLAEAPSLSAHTRKVRVVYDDLQPHFARWTPSANFRSIFARTVLDEIHRVLARVQRVRILEVGCGHGTWAEEIYRQIKNPEQRMDYLGIDLSSVRIADAQQRLAAYPGVQVFVADSETFQPPGPVDLILAIEVLDHVPRRRYAAWLAQWRQWLVPGGAFVVIDKERFSRHALRISVEQFQRRFCPWLTRRSRGYFPQEYRELVSTLAYPGFARLSRLARRTGFISLPVVRHDMFHALIARRPA
ncbi:MAG: class I SAM-dependent methyltransferase [Phycisphaerae bacterium]